MKIADLVARLQSLPPLNKRRLIAIVGGPASGKSTLADKLARGMQNARVVPMDGFHRDNADLERHGLLDRKGAPETFDVAGLISVVQAIRAKPNVTFPTFDRRNDCVVPQGGQLTAADQIIFVEGNYLLLKQVPWRALADLWDFSIKIDVPPPVLRDRLQRRWVHYGLTPHDALARAEHNDIPNAQTVAQQSLPADLVIGAEVT